MAEDNFYRYLSTTGATGGTKNAVGDYSSSATDFYFVATPGPAWVERLILYIEDTKGMEPEEYGNLGAALTNGWSIKVKDADDVVLLDINDGIPVKTNAGIGRMCYDVDLKAWTNTTNEVVLARFTFSRAGSELKLNAGEKLVITLNDSFVGLIDHYFQIQGHY